MSASKRLKTARMREPYKKRDPDDPRIITMHTRKPALSVRLTELSDRIKSLSARKRVKQRK